MSDSARESGRSFIGMQNAKSRWLDAMAQRPSRGSLASSRRSVTVRIAAGTNGYVLTAKILNGAGGYQPGSVARDTTITLRTRRQHRISTFYPGAVLGTAHDSPSDGTIGLDGAQWVLEGLSAERYHVVNRWSPQPTGPDRSFRRLAEWILARSGLVHRRSSKRTERPSLSSEHLAESAAKRARGRRSLAPIRSPRHSRQASHLILR